MISLEYEKKYWIQGKRYITGVDEAGRGPLAGPVVAAAVVFQPDVVIEGIKDSKLLSEKEREKLFDIIKEKALCFGVGTVEPDIIDKINILNATFRSMHEAISKLKFEPEHLLIDGPHFPGANIPYTKIVDGDSKCFSIAAASIIAKVSRDRLMIEYDKRFPGYGFAKHKGYGTKDHLEAIKKYGLCEIHRKSFKIQAGLVKAND